MGSCWSDGSHGGGGMVGVGGGTTSSAATPNDAVDYYLKSRGYNGLFSQIEVRFFLFLSPRFQISAFTHLLLFGFAVIFLCFQFARPGRDFKGSFFSFRKLIFLEPIKCLG